MVQALRDFLERPVGILTIHGGVGTGKSMGLHAVANELRARGKEAMYVTPFDLFGHVRSAYDHKREGETGNALGRLRQFEQAPVLIIDEFDKRNDTPWLLDQLTDLIEKRYRLGEAEEAGSLIAMNSDPALQPAWIASRLLYGRNRVVRNDDPDIRPALR